MIDNIPFLILAFFSLFLVGCESLSKVVDGAIDTCVQEKCWEKSDPPPEPPRVGVEEPSEPVSITPAAPEHKIKTVYIRPNNSDFYRLCPRKIGGDREFSSNGPNVKISASAYVRGNSVYITASIDAKETRSNWSHAKSEWTKKIQSFPGYSRVRVASQNRAYHSYTDTNHSADIIKYGGNSLVSRFESKGDTKGNDIGNCTSDDVYLTVEFNPIKVELTL